MKSRIGSLAAAFTCVLTIAFFSSAHAFQDADPDSAAPVEAESEQGAGEETPPEDAAAAVNDAEGRAGEGAQSQEGDTPADENAPADAEGALDGAEQQGEPADATAMDGAFQDAARDWGRLQPVADLIDAGGPIIVILGVLSVISLAIIIVKLFQFTALRVGDHRFVDKAARMLQNGERQQVLDFVSRRRGVIARIMEAALRGRMMSSDEQHVREEVERVARAKLDGLERGLPLLSLIATISPLLGLLGTVLGMIEAFQQLENAGDRVDPAILSGGIWEALLTTAAGLSVAIPSAAFFTWLQRSVEVAGQHMEDAATRVFTATLYEKNAAAGEGDEKQARLTAKDKETAAA